MYVRPPGYHSLIALKRRCREKKHHQYFNYGARGITYPPKWETYAGFWEDMGSTHKPGLTIDRIDVDGNYCKENCRWATPLEQIRNKRNTMKRTLNGIEKSVSEWCDIYGVPYRRVKDRLYMGWDIERALSTRLHNKGIG